ncbi:hypothetical protein [uncultured Alteromonas sp.]|jgi:hypothetical protein|uniref:hypothetical protein n=1 Tax=uncultured Alteromonas sp. TaxID=179113 RepID=UPI0025E7DFEC|nr:hypothetical protein [uncultured Alteromonas sp.]
MRIINNVYVFVFLLAHGTALHAQSYDGPDLGEPSFSAIDRKHVNMVNGTISYSINDVSIGVGDLSLEHSISINANDALNWESPYPGYKDKYFGGIRRTLFSQSENGSQRFEVLSVFDYETTYYFEITSSGTYDAVGNDLVTLTKLDSYTLLLTKEDGTLVKFRTEQSIPATVSQTYTPYAYMKEINYPNGFTVNIHKSSHSLGAAIKSVTTNNGLQLKYVYEIHSRPLESAKQSATNNPNISADSLNWSATHPSEIIALNNAVEVCPLLADSCSPSGDWPKASYSWPDGMPRAFYIGESDFVVTNAGGGVTTFHHKALSKAPMYGDSGSTVNAGLENDYFPRIIRIEKPDGKEVTYRFRNYAQVNNEPPFTWFTYLAHGIMDRATINGQSTDYTFGPARTSYASASSGMYNHVATGDVYHGVKKVVTGYQSYSGGKIATGPIIVETWDKTVYLSNDLANKVEQIDNELTGVPITYSYDSLGRLVEVVEDGLIDINYPQSYCSPKNCNKPSSVSNKHNSFQGFYPEYTTTSYNYSTGLIQSVTSPPNKHNKVKTVRYTQQAYYARYKNENGTMANSTTPITLISSQYYCKNSNMSGTTCESNDKVTTTYHYGSGSAGNNLFLIGETLSAQGESTTYTTCYKYDKYGNQIGVSLPESGVTDCNAGRAY